MEQATTSGGARRVAFCSFLFGTTCLLAASCGFDDRGLLEPPGSNGGSGPSTGSGGKSPGSTSSGGAPGSGGKPAPGNGSGGSAGDLGATGGKIGSGGVPSASGGTTAPGGTQGASSGGVPGGVAGQGGGKSGGNGGQSSPGTGGRGGGAAGMNAGMGGAAKGGAGGVNPTGGAGGVGGAPAAGGAGGSLPCGPKTCATGCCDGDRCVTQHANDRCGANGAACAKCNSCFRCGNAGACEVDPMSTWKVVCVAATLSSTKGNFQTWDDQFQTGGGPGGPGSGGPGSLTSYLPDPVCELSTGNNDKVVGSTMVVGDTTSAKWNETITPSPLTAAQLMSQSTPWAISVSDDDGRDGTELACRVTPQLTTNDFVSTDLTFNNIQSCLSLSVRLVCVP